MPQPSANIGPILSIVFAFCVTSTCAQCYLEDTSATCAVCWKDGNPASAKECPPGVDVTWDLPTTKMYDKYPYPTNYVIKINRTLYPIEASGKGKNHDVIHANIHSCVAKLGACTPFVGKSPGLSVHTPANKGNFSALEFAGTPTKVNIGNHGFEAKFHSEVKLPIEDYMVIAHLRFYTRAPGAAKPTRWDVAIGSPRAVEEAPVEISTDSIIGVVCVGLLLIIFIASCLWGMRSGKVNLEAIIASVTTPEISLVVDLILAVLDAIAFTACFIEEVLPVNSLQNIVPFCVLILVVVWVGSIFALYAGSLQAKEMYQERFKKAEFVQQNIDMSKTASADGNIEGYSERRQEEMGRLAAQRSKMLRNKSRVVSNLITLFLEDIPIAAINTYILFEIGPDTFVVASLMISMLLLGHKGSAVAQVANMSKKLEAATEEIRAEAAKRNSTSGTDIETPNEDSFVREMSGESSQSGGSKKGEQTV